MALINRFSRLFTADLHAVMDRMEEPESLLKQAIREMEEELSNMQLQAQQCGSDVERLTTQEQEMENRLSEIEQELDVCFGSEEEKLTKALIKRKLEVERRAKAVASKRAEITKTMMRLESDIVENQQAFNGMQLRLASLVTAAPRGAPIDITGGDYNVSNEEIEIAFLREKQRRAGR